jgi:hypothetical protein
MERQAVRPLRRLKMQAVAQGTPLVKAVTDAATRITVPNLVGMVVEVAIARQGVAVAAEMKRLVAATPYLAEELPGARYMETLP